MSFRAIGGLAVFLSVGWVPAFVAARDAGPTAGGAVPTALMAREVTAAEYRVCVRAGRCTRVTHWQPRQLPIVWVTQAQAAAYCAFVGSRLPTDGEWSAAAAVAGTRFPWGDDPLRGRANCIWSEMGRSLRPPGSFPDDQVAGMFDLYANALEWTADGTVRGALYCGEPFDTHQRVPTEGADPYLGFRCVAPRRK